MTAKEVLSAESLKNVLWETLLKVRDNEMDWRKANAISGQSCEIMRVVRTEIAVSVLTEQKPSRRLLTFVGKGV